MYIIIIEVMSVKEKLFNKDYTLLWLGLAVSQLGAGAASIGLMWWIQTTTGSAMLLGTMAMVRTIIGVALSPLGGVIADKVSKKAIIVLTDFVNGTIYSTLAYLVYTEQLTYPVLLVLVAGSAICSTFFNPAISATVPLLVSKPNLPRANSLQQITSNVVSIVGYTAGGILVAFLGIPLLLAVNGVAFLLSALSELFINIPKLVSEGKARSGQFLQDLKEGLDYARKKGVLMEIMRVAAVLNFVAAPMFILLPKYVQEHLGASPAVYGYLLAAFMGGTLCASLLIAFTKVVERNLWLVIHSITPQAVAMIIVVLLPAELNAIRIPLFLLMGFLNGIVNIYFAAIIQRTTAPEQMGRVWGLINTMSGGLQPISQGLTGFLGDRVSIPIIYIVSGCLEGVCGLRFSVIPNLHSYLASEDEQAANTPSTALSSADN